MSTTGAVRIAENCVTALVVDLADMSCFEASAIDLNDTGCWIVSDKVDLLKKEVGLRLAGTDKLVRGTVTAYADNEARVSFLAEDQATGEKRREVRRSVWIGTVVSGKTSPFIVKCRIIDASRSGCRLEADGLDRLPQDIEISIPGLGMPIAAKIIWRKNGQAGVRLNWPFDPAPVLTPEMVTAMLDREQERQPREEEPKKPRKRISAFGS
ncbi:MAG: PilZ domain-containing protein [Roseibium sp.]|uniref:PilZ domain-containing protein n=1 Tax=Roseibium sp. TaxID=1936156 RepID=UPI003D9C476E